MSSEVIFEGAQKAAVTHDKGPMLVLAGPGSGKTFTITHRIKYLTEECRVNPSSILVITFTKAAATEMKERYESLCGGGTVICQFRHISCHIFPNLKICIQV